MRGMAVAALEHASRSTMRAILRKRLSINGLTTDRSNLEKKLEHEWLDIYIYIYIYTTTEVSEQKQKRRTDTL